MFNLLVKFSGWAEGRDLLPNERAFEYTSPALLARFQQQGARDFDSLIRLPSLFMQENQGSRPTAPARLGTIVRVVEAGRSVHLEYVFDPSIPPFPFETIESLSGEIGLGNLELTRTHWAVKDADLFRALIRYVPPRRPKPRVFDLADPERIEPLLVSAMMPFDAAFDPVYSTLKEASDAVGLRCRRADDIWENPAVIQDVVSLIDRSRVIICDCSGRNPNVFYEIGIAHTLGREVILITQADSDIPFDLRHLRYVKYLNNGEGRNSLRSLLIERLELTVST